MAAGAEIKTGFMAVRQPGEGRRASERVSVGYGCGTARRAPVALSPAGHLETERTVTMAT